MVAEEPCEHRSGKRMPPYKGGLIANKLALEVRAAGHLRHSRDWSRVGLLEQSRLDSFRELVNDLVAQGLQSFLPLRLGSRRAYGAI